MSESEIKYIELVAIKRIGTYKQAAEYIGDKNPEDIKNLYGKIGGIEKFIADQLNLSLEELGTLKSFDHVIEKKEKIDKLFNNQFSSNIARKDGFKSFENFYAWYLEQNDLCYFCETSSETLDNLFTSKSLQSTKFNATLHIEQLDPKKGYNPENCRLACSLCNNAKSDLISKENYRAYFSKSMKRFLIDLSDGKITNITYE
jgi:5-methylcytosine-specific restriction endonuclease McrA